MDSLKSAAGKIKKSPRALKCKIDSAFHRDKLDENWIHNRENVQNGVAFNMKLLGKKPATSAQGKGCTDSIVEDLVNKHKSKGKNEKLPKISIRVDSKKMIVRDLVTHELLEDIPVHRISYCTADPHYPKIFALISREKGTKQLYTHVFLTNKKEMAEAVALTVAQAFTMAYEEWEEQSKERQQEIEHEQENEAASLYGDLGGETETNMDKDSNKITNSEDSTKDDFNFIATSLAPKMETVVIVEPGDDQSDDGDEFLRFARQRTASTGLLDTGLVRRETFKGNVTEYLAVNNTLRDLECARSTEDLTSISPVPSPIPSPLPSPKGRSRNRNNPFTNLTYTEPTSVQPPENLIEF